MNAREIARYETLIALRQGARFTHVNMCDCVSVPINYWLHRDGTWSEHPVTGDSIADGIAYNEAACVGWVIACPRCGRQFQAGLTVRHAARR
jgi:hypothetical protein